MSTERIAQLERFIRNQANLTDGKKPMPGPGCVQLNHAEAIEVADALGELISSKEPMAAIGYLIAGCSVVGAVTILTKIIQILAGLMIV